MTIEKWTLVLALAGALAGCGDDDAVPVADAGRDGGGADAGQDAGETPDAGPPDTGVVPDAGPDPMVERGRYLVHHVAACTDCHTPRGAMGMLDETRTLAGSPMPFADLNPGDDTMGAVYAPNLTNHATGLMGWTDAQIKRAFLDGLDADGNPLFPIMPYYVLHNMSAEDADAIVAYLRTVPGVDQAIPDRQPLPFPFTMPAAPVPEASIPRTTLAAADPMFAAAERGRYLAGNVGVCMECHTPESAMGSPTPIDITRLFVGNRVFARDQLGLPPSFPEMIHTRNLTPHASGIQGWTAEQVRDALKLGIDAGGTRLCPPMPAGMMMAFGGLTDEDALAIGVYLTTLAPVDSGTIPDCMPPAM
jgi:mono/diheme cytochrome c family protein